MLDAMINYLLLYADVIGLWLGFLGAIVVTLFGLPPIGLLNEGMYTEIVITKNMKRSMWVSRIGLLLVAFSFSLQLISIYTA